MFRLHAAGAVAAALLWSSTMTVAEPRHGIAMNGEPAMATDFKNFSYVNPDAPKGGSITYCVVGSFDNLNPFILKSLRTTARGMIDTIFGHLVFEGLMHRSADEAFSLYGLLAQTADMSDDRRTVEFALNPDAKWSDGQPVTPEDVIFTYEVYTEKGRPPYSDRMAKIEKIEKTGDRSVKFTFNDKADREFPLIIALTPVLPKHATDKATFDETTLKPMVGSGPYTVDKIVPGQRISFKRNPNYWAKGVPAKKGMDNYDEIIIEYFLNTNAQFEAFKKGICSAYAGSTYTGMSPLQVEREFDFPAANNGDVVVDTFKLGLPPVMTGFMFNTRLPKFADPQVRRALAMLYDFEWANKNLLSDKFERTVSFWQGSELSAVGNPAGDKEKALLAAYPDAVLPEVMDGSYKLPVTDGSGQDRKVMRAALDLLQQAGYKLEGGKLIDPQGTQLAFEILTSSDSEQRLAALYQRTLEKLGIGVSIRALEADQIQARKQRFDFDMLVASIGFTGSLSPGIEQIGRWGSSSATKEGSFNLGGVASPAVDAAIDAMLNARSKEDYVAAVRVLDRLLISGAYMVPFQHNTDQLLARWKYLKYPEKTPVFGFQLATWWRQD